MLNYEHQPTILDQEGLSEISVTTKNKLRGIALATELALSDQLHIQRESINFHSKMFSGWEINSCFMSDIYSEVLISTKKQFLTRHKADRKQYMYREVNTYNNKAGRVFGIAGHAIGLAQDVNQSENLIINYERAGYMSEILTVKDVATLRPEQKKLFLASEEDYSLESNTDYVASSFASKVSCFVREVNDINLEFDVLL